MLSDDDRRRLLTLADTSVCEGLATGRPLTVDSARLSARLARPGSCFVTLKHQQQLRGCIGTLEAYRSLAEDCAGNAFAAAFQDPRFPPLAAEEYLGLQFHISVLEPATPVLVNSEEELLAQLKPGADGLVLTEGRRRATFLPSVWEQLPDPVNFLRHLKRKAGLPDDYWSPHLLFSRYGVEDFHS